MRYRKLTSTGDYTFGQSQANFYVNDAQAVAQSVMTRLKLWRGEWFLDTQEGTPWLQEVLGYNTQTLYDLAIQQRVLATEGVSEIVQYLSEFDGATRNLSISMYIKTVFSPEPVEVVL